MRAIVTGGAGSTPATGVFNVGTGKTSILELHGLYAETAGGGLRPRFAPERPGDLRHSVLDRSRAERELGWRATMTVANGLAQPWDSVRAQ
jgi:UDP-glucose 4-epimerase